MWKGVLRYDVTTSEIKVGYAALIIFFWYKLFSFYMGPDLITTEALIYLDTLCR